MLRSAKGFIVGAAVGTAVTWFADPHQGRRRRALLAEQSAATARHAREAGRRRARDAQGRAHGAAARSVGHGRFDPADDRDLAAHLRQLLADIDADTGDLTFEVVDGHVRVRGQVPLAEHRDRIMAMVQEQPGVVVAECLLHLPGQSAPNKAASLDASRAAD